MLFCCPLTNNKNFALNLVYIHLVLVSVSWQINCKIFFQIIHLDLLAWCLEKMTLIFHKWMQMVVFDGDLPGFYTKTFIQVHNRSNIIRKVPIFQEFQPSKAKKTHSKGILNIIFLYNIDTIY